MIFSIINMFLLTSMSVYDIKYKKVPIIFIIFLFISGCIGYFLNKTDYEGNILVIIKRCLIILIIFGTLSMAGIIGIADTLVLVGMCIQISLFKIFLIFSLAVFMCFIFSLVQMAYKGRKSKNIYFIPFIEGGYLLSLIFLN